MLLSLQRQFIYRPTRAKRLAPEQAGLNPQQVQAVSYRTDDGLTLHGWHVQPESPVTRGPKTLLFFQGSHRNRAHRGLTLRVLAWLGLHVYVFDYRGYAENPGRPTEDHLARDARALWTQFLRDHHQHPQQVLIYGESLGGGVATRLVSEMCQSGSPPAGLILCATFSSLADAGAHNYPWLPVRTILGESYPSRDRISKVTVPILVMHGGRDRVVPLTLAERLYAAAPERSASGIAKQIAVFPQAGHNDILRIASKLYCQAMSTFLIELQNQPG